jgi:hypothetical protein
MTNQWPTITDPVGRELLGRAGDLKARFILIDCADAVYEGPGRPAQNAAVASLMHACDYLKDRIGYEMAPHPKGMIKQIVEATA